MDLMLILQVAVEAAAEVAEQPTMNLWTMATYGGPIMIVLALMLAFGVYLFIERMVTLKQASKEDSTFMNRIKDKELPCTVGASFSVQEEVGERGVMANARALQPEALICFEGCPADDTFSEPYMVQAAMGKGVMLRHMDISMITNHRFQKFALDTARKHGIPVQESVRKGGGTNAAKIYEELGVPGIVIGVKIPTK